MSTTSVPLPTLDPKQITSLDAWLRSILWESTLPPPGVQPSPSETKPQGFEIHRLKGRILLNDGTQKMIQGVREVFEILDADKLPVDEDEVKSVAQGKIVLIGRGLGDLSWEASLRNSLGV